jgi:hypothetical protein
MKHVELNNDEIGITRQEFPAASIWWFSDPYGPSCADLEYPLSCSHCGWIDHDHDGRCAQCGREGREVATS